jgi:arginase family enzyme
VDVLAETGLYDAGDVRVTHGDIPASFTAVQEAVQALHGEGRTLITLGGDGTVTLPQLRAVSRRHPGFAVVHFDAHTDAYPYPGYIGATAFTRAAEEGLLDTRRTFHVGMREPVSVGGLRRFANDLGYTVITMRELRRRGIEETMGHIRRQLDGMPVYLCFDVDFFEPAIVPGIFTPLCDGALPHEGLELVRGLKGLDLVHFDINNVTPNYDVHGFTALLGAHLAWMCVDLFARASMATPPRNLKEATT